jgi:hypothetical protein
LQAIDRHAVGRFDDKGRLEPVAVVLRLDAHGPAREVAVFAVGSWLATPISQLPLLRGNAGRSR